MRSAPCGARSRMLRSERQLPPTLVEAGNLPLLPLVVREILSSCRQEGASPESLARVLARDPVLAPGLLRFASSSLYGAGEEVRTLERAVLLLGTKGVGLLSLCLTLVRGLPHEGDDGAFDYERFWRRSVTRAVAARRLAGAIGSFAQDEAFAAGLFAEIGRAVLAGCLPEEYGALLRATGESWPSLDLERSALGFDQAEVGEALLATWQFPPLVWCCVGALQRPDELPRDAPDMLQELVRILAVASAAADALTRRAGPPGSRIVQELGARYFRLSPEATREFLGALETPIRETSSMLELLESRG